MQHQEVEVEGVENGAPHLEVDEERLWRDVGVERLSVSDFPHPHIINDGEDELHSLLPLRIIGAALGALGLVHRFRARADDGCGIVINCHVVGSNSCWFGEIHAIANCVICHRLNEANQVVVSLCFL